MCPHLIHRLSDLLLNHDNIPLKLIFGKSKKFDTKNQSHDFFKIINIFHEKIIRKQQSQISDKLFEEFQEFKSIHDNLF